MHRELELWRFIADRLQNDASVMLLVVAESSGSSPGRAGYKMAVAGDGELYGSVGGGVMEVKLVEESRVILRDTGTRGRGDAGTSVLREQVHQGNSKNASGLICSGKQTVILKLLTPGELGIVLSIIAALQDETSPVLEIKPETLTVGPPEGGTPYAHGDPPTIEFRTSVNPQSKIHNLKFSYTELLGFENHLYIIGGGHCALALSEIMSNMDFHISLFDDRPELNTIEKNRFAHEIKIIDGYDRIGEYVREGERSFVVIMTLGFESDARAIRSLIGKNFKYFGVLGSNAKMTSMFKDLIKEGLPREILDRIRTPVGIPIRSRTPEEIAVSIAAEIISVKNAD